jgi:TP901 family phage tail tape measure protein
VTEENVELKIEIVTKGAQFNIDKLKKSVEDVETTAKSTGQSATKQFQLLTASIGSLEQAFRESSEQSAKLGQTASSDMKKLTKAVLTTDKSVIKLDKDTKKLGKTTKKAGDDGTKSFARLNQATKAVDKSISDAAKQMAAFVTVAAAAGGLLLAIKLASQFETGLLGVAKTTGLAGAELDSLAKNITNLSKNIPVATSELLELGQAAGQLGVKGQENILKFSEVVAKLGRTTDVSGERAAQSLARILNVTGEAISSVDTFASVLVRLGNNVAATESQILRITSEIARTTALFGVSSAEAAALGAAMVSMGARAESAGSATGRVFQEMQKRISQGGESLDEFANALGINAEVLAETFTNDKIAGFELFLESLRDLGSERAGAVLKDIGLGGQEIIKTMSPLAKNIDKYREAQRLANIEVANATALNEEFNATLGSLDSQFELFKNNLKVFATAGGNELLPSLTTSFMELNASMRAFTSNESGFRESLDNISNGFEAFANIIAIGGAYHIGLKILPVLSVAAIAGFKSMTVSLALLNAGALTMTGTNGFLTTSMIGTGVAATGAAAGLRTFSGALGVVGIALGAFQLGTFIGEFQETRLFFAGFTRDVSNSFDTISNRIDKFFAAVSDGGRGTAEYKAEIDLLDKQLNEHITTNNEFFALQTKVIDGTVGETEAAKTLRLELKELLETKAAFANELSEGFVGPQQQNNPLLPSQKKDTDDLADSVFSLGKAHQSVLDKVFPLIAQSRKYKTEAGLLKAALKSQGKEQFEIDAAIRKLKISYSDLYPEIALINAAMSEGAILQQEQVDKYNELTDALFPLAAETKTYNEELALLTEHHERVGTSTDEFKDATDRLKKSHIDLFPELKKQEEAAEELAESWEEAGKRIDEAFADAWEGAFDSFEDFSDAIVDSMKKLLAELAHQILTKPLLINLGLGGGGAGGVSGGGVANSIIGGSIGAAATDVIGNFISGGAGAATASGGGFGIASTFSNGIGSGFSDIGSGFLSQFSSNAPVGGTFFNSTLAEQGGSLVGNSAGSTSTAVNTSGAGGFNIGSAGAQLLAGFAGAFVGNKLGELAFNKEANSSLGAASGALIGAQIGSAVPVLGTLIGAAVGALVDVFFGSSAPKDPRFTIGTTNEAPSEFFGRDDIVKTSTSAFGNVKFGSDKDLAAGFSQQDASSFFEFFDAIAGLENVIADSVDPATTAQISAAVSTQADLFKKKSFDFQEFFVERFDTIFDTIGGTVDDAFDKITSSIKDTDLLGVIDQVIGASFVVGEATGDLKTYFDAISDTTEIITKTVNDFGDLRAEFEGGRQGFDQFALTTRTVEVAISGLNLASIAAGKELIFLNEVLKDLGGVTLTLDRSGSSAAQTLIELSGGLETFVTKVADLQQSLQSLGGSLFGSLQSFIQLELDSIREVNVAKMDLYKVDLEHYESALNAAERLNDAYGEAFLVGATTQESFEFNQDRFSTLKAAANAGDTDSAAELASFASTFLESAQDNFASGDRFQEIKTGVLADLESLGLKFSTTDAPTLPELDTIESLDEDGNAKWPELLELMEKQNALIENQRLAEEALFVAQITELALATNQDINTLLEGLGITVDQSVLSALTANASLTSSLLGDIISLADGTNQSVVDVLGSIGLSIVDLATLVDGDGDGLTVAEITAAGLDAQTVALLAGLDINNDGIVTVLEALDTNQDGLLSAVEVGNANQSTLTSLLESLDADGDGIISAVEANGILTSSLYEALFNNESFDNLSKIADLAGLDLSNTDVLSALADVDWSNTDLLTLLSGIDWTNTGLLTELSLVDWTNTDVLSTLSGLNWNNTDVLTLLSTIDWTNTGTLSDLAGINWSNTNTLTTLSTIDWTNTGALTTLSGINWGNTDQLSAIASLDFSNIDSITGLAGININDGALINSIVGLASQISATDFSVTNITNHNNTTTQVTTTVAQPFVLIDPTNSPIQGPLQVDPNAIDPAAVISTPAPSGDPVAAVNSAVAAYNAANGTNFNSMLEVIEHRGGLGLGNVHLADGGIVTGPVNALIGEGGQSEAVIPLDDFSNQISRLESRIAELISVSNRISDERSAEHVDAQNSRDDANRMATSSLEIADDLEQNSASRFTSTEMLV